LLALVVELRQGQRSRRWMNRRASGRGIAVRVVVAIVAAFGMLYIGIVEFYCIAMTGSSDDFSAEMDGRLFAFVTVPIAALLLLTGFALVMELFAERVSAASRPMR
jgi:hypothetical protein